MKSVRMSEFGEPAAVCDIEEIEMPEPGPGEMRVKVTHRPINPSDTATIRGVYGRLPTLPATPGMEGFGVVDALGEGVKGFAVGQRVVPMGMSGTWQEYGITSAMQALPVPDAVSDQSAAQFIVNPVTSWVMLTEGLGLKEGDWVLQTAAGSTLGRIVLQIAKLKGYKTVNLVRRREQVDELLALGADAVFCTADGHDAVIKQVMAATGKGVHGAIESVGDETGTLAHSCLRAGGTMLVYGLLSGMPSTINWGEMLFKGTTIQGFWLTHWFRVADQGKVKASLVELMQLMSKGDLTPPVEKEYPLSEIKAALEHSERPGRSGKILLVND
ncbi:MAG: zinc-dependent alcohol dehydrogenase family protein [Chloroflexota bacterium]